MSKNLLICYWYWNCSSKQQTRPAKPDGVEILFECTGFLKTSAANHQKDWNNSRAGWTDEKPAFVFKSL
ncbi:hypothetical protein [Pedobacter sp. Leaf170]|uniref:hypothetical protein n=1 Tax=Pedobacter sp. Leaf170 TaxID=2876558 RepID=UPI001E3AB1E8|nr:hypothetical protein [Pedobacter sp. Leaf170]